MSSPGFALFETAIGCSGIVWSNRGILSVQLPEGDERRTRGRLLRRFLAARESTPPAHIENAIGSIVALLEGKPRELGDVILDEQAVPDFNRRVYAVARTIPHGRSLSYGEIAERLGDRTLARDVAQALGQNPFPIIVPCHRVVAAGGKTGGFSASGGVPTKLRLLSIEGADPAGEGPSLFGRLPLVAAPRRRKAP
jgi:methylated-DNA-[protein]-cysteine S-methyltransferase